MAYDTKELEQQAIQAIDANNLCFIEDVVAAIPCSKPTFYEHNLNELDSIKSRLEQNKINQKQALRQKWADSDNSTLSIALYKLLANDDEFARLTKQHLDHTTDGESFNTDINKLSIEKLTKIRDVLNDE
jgi:hypothetical protein